MNEHERKRAERVSRNAWLFSHRNDKEPLRFHFQEANGVLSILEKSVESWWELPIFLLEIDRARIVLNLVPLQDIDGTISRSMRLEHDGFYIQCDVVWSETQDGSTIMVEVFCDLSRDECARRLSDFQQVVDDMIDEHNEILMVARTCSASLALQTDRLSVG